MKYSGKRVILIGIDGATWDLIDKFIDQNKLSGFARLKKEGSYGRLKSTVPCHSPLAWNSIFTGVNPGKHGIFGFIKQQYGSANLEFYNSGDRKFPGMWNYTTHYGIESVYINIPFSYPLEEVGGVFISGLGTPSGDCPYTSPELKKYISRHFPQYKIDFDERVMSKKKDKDLFSEGCLSILANRLSLASHLFISRSWQVFSLVIRATDVVQHFCWDDPDLIRGIYQKIDNFLSFLTSRMSAEDTLIIVSDHGFSKLKSMIHLVNYFFQEGYMVTKGKRKAGRGLDLQLIKKIALPLLGSKGMQWLKRESNLQEFFFKHLPIGEYSYFSSVDWPSSLISYVEGSTGIANFSPALKKDQKRLESFFGELRAKTRSLGDEEGERVFEDVYRGRDLFWPDSPDVIFKTRPGYGVDGYDCYDRSTFSKSRKGYQGIHDENGLLLLFNSMVNKGYRLKAHSLYDILPTIFYILGLDIPDYLDGKVIEEAFTEKVAQKRVSLSKDIFMKKKGAEDALKAEDKENLKAQLKSLGYL